MRISDWSSDVCSSDLSVQALFTSPLFPLCSKIKSYGTMTPSEWLPWMLELMGSWMPLMKEDGCMAIHLGSAVYYRGMPAISSYRERFVVEIGRASCRDRVCQSV